MFSSTSNIEPLICNAKLTKTSLNQGYVNGSICDLGLYRNNVLFVDIDIISEDRDSPRKAEFSIL